jgi:hypothetical protein
MENPKIEEGKYYKIKIKYFGREIEYYCKIKWIRGNSFKIITEDDHKLIFKLSDLFYAKEISKEKVEKEYKPVWVKGILKKNQKKEEQPKYEAQI